MLQEIKFRKLQRMDISELMKNPVKSSYKVKRGDKIKILFTHPPYENLLTPENIDLDIVFEDESIIIINKPAGLVVHPGHGNYSGTLINGLLYHLKIFQ